LPSGQRPKWDEIIIYVVQGRRKIKFCVSTAGRLDKCIIRNKASDIEPSKQVDAGGNDSDFYS
jgi:hypothetical protein